jgi:membrane-bound metal-dependent hydrolase YbcI (DUF457 family)
MFLFGHAGLTMGAARAADRDADLRFAAFFALLPDLLDKPVYLLAPAAYHGNTRGFGHSAAGALVALALLYALPPLRRRKPLLLWCCLLGHLALDLMWTSNHPAVLLWPLLGHFPAPIAASYGRPFVLYNAAGELAGLCVAAALLRRRLKAGA